MQADERGRQYALDGLRGYLAFGVFVHHLVIYYPYLENGLFVLPDSNFYSQLGRVSVALFFMVTGYLFWGRVLDTAGHIDWGRFVLNRLFRIYPLYLAALACVLLIVFGHAGWRMQVSAMALMEQLAAWLVFARPAINGFALTGNLIANVSWTLSYELFFYLTLPCFVLLTVKRRGWLRPIAAALLIYALYKVMGASAVLKHSVLLTFLGGVAAAHWTRYEPLRRWSDGRFAAAIAVLLLMCVMFGWGTPFAPIPFLLLTGFFCIVASGNNVFGALSVPAVRWMGEISYSTYLLHGLLLWAGLVWLPGQLGIDPRNPFYWFVFCAVASIVVIVLSSAAYLYIERPGIRTGHRLAAWLMPKRAASAPGERLR